MFSFFRLTCYVLVIMIWTLVIGMMLMPKSEATVVYPRDPLKVLSGEKVDFMCTSNVKILEATWGIRSSSHSAHPQYIFVRAIDEVPVINPELDADLKSRVSYLGNLTRGHAWFSLSNVNLNDSNWYIALIREEGSSTMPYYIQLIVESPPTAPPTSQSPITQFPTTQAPTVFTNVSKTNSSAYPTAGPVSSASSLSKDEIVITIIFLFATMVIKCLRN